MHAGTGSHSVIRGITYGLFCAAVLFQLRILFVQAEAPTTKAYDYPPNTAEVVLAHDKPKTEIETAPKTTATTTEKQNIFTARGAYLAEVGSDMTLTPLFTKESTSAFPIASITKLMTSYVALSELPATTTIDVSKDVVNEEWPSKRFVGGEKLTLDELVQAMLIESNNDAARAVADAFGRDAFVAKMNETASALGLYTMRFVNPAGLDPEQSSAEPNNASAEDVAKLALLFGDKYSDYGSLGAYSAITISVLDPKRSYTAYNTNYLVRELSKRYTVLVSKTGSTDLANHNLVVVLKDKDSSKKYVAVVLGSDDSFSDMSTVLTHIPR